MFGGAGELGDIDFFGGGCRHFLFHIGYTALKLPVGIHFDRLVGGAGSTENPGKSIRSDGAFGQRSVGIQADGLTVVADNSDRLRIGTIKGQDTLLGRTILV